MPLTVSVPRIFSSFCHAVRWTLPPSVSQSAPQLSTQPAARATTTGNVRIPILIPLTEPSETYQSPGSAKPPAMLCGGPWFVLLVDGLELESQRQHRPAG